MKPRKRSPSLSSCSLGTTNTEKKKKATASVMGTRPKKRMKTKHKSGDDLNATHNKDIKTYCKPKDKKGCTIKLNYTNEDTNSIPRTVSEHRVVLEYVYVNHTKFELMTRTRVADVEPKSIEDCPSWESYMWNDVRQESFFEMILNPVAMFENPFFKSPHKIVLCELMKTAKEPADINTRRTLEKTLKTLSKKDQLKKAQKPWFGIEQEYFFTGDDGFPLSYEPKHYNYKSIILFSKIGHPHALNIGKEREFSNRHLMACIYAGVKIGGCTRENGPSQWEYQIGPCEGIDIGDHLHVSRFILHRLLENSGMNVNFKPVPVEGECMTSSGHLNFSTEGMRKEDGIKIIKCAIDVLSKSDQEPLLRSYDPSLTEENKERLNNTSGHWHPKMDVFVDDVANKEFTTIRIPPLVAKNGCGYFEDRRPSSKIDPYAAATAIVKACVFGVYLKPEHKDMDLGFWC